MKDIKGASKQRRVPDAKKVILPLEGGRAVGEGWQGELEEVEVPGRASLGGGARGPGR